MFSWRGYGESQLISQMPISITVGTFDIYELFGIFHSAQEFVHSENKQLKERKFPSLLLPITSPHSTEIYSKENTASYLPLGKFPSHCQCKSK